MLDIPGSALRSRLAVGQRLAEHVELRDLPGVALALGLDVELGAAGGGLVLVGAGGALVDEDQQQRLVALQTGHADLTDLGGEDDLLLRGELLDLTEELVVLAQGLAGE